VLQFRELPERAPAPGELLIRVRASGVNPSDTKERSGFGGQDVMPSPRIIPHQESAGAVGRYAVQFAKHGGARVIATVSREAQAVSVRAADAHLVLNRHTDDLSAAVAAFAGREHGVARVIEVSFNGNLGLDIEIRARNGVTASSSSNVEKTTIPYRPLAYLDATILAGLSVPPLRHEPLTPAPSHVSTSPLTPPAGTPRRRGALCGRRGGGPSGRGARGRC